MTTKPVRLNHDGHGKGLVASDLIASEAFTSGDTTELISHAWTADDGSILTGVWVCAPCREEIDAYPVNEMMTVLEGSVTVTDDTGKAQTYTPGDTFFIPKGAPCTWEITSTLRKFYMIAA
ncbi:MAG: cupin domain-containing protein [bacterium]|nr:cupin domain-containing protein [bacterium]